MNQIENIKQESEHEPEKVTLYLSDLWKGFLKFWWVCIVLAVLAGGYKYVTGRAAYVPLYTSSATFTVSTENNMGSISGVSAYAFYYDSTTASQLEKTFPYILSSNLLQDAVCEDMKVDVMQASLNAVAVAGSNMFTMTATGMDPQITYDVLISAIKNYPSVAKYVVGNIKLNVITPAEVSTQPSNSAVYKNTALKWALYGAVLGLAFILLYAFIRDTIRTKKDLKSELNCEALGVIPQVIFKKHKMSFNKSVLLTNDTVGSGFKESFRVLRNTFLHSLQNGEKVVTVTSTAPGEGKTTVITNLALSLAEHGKKVLIIDADLRHPSVAALLDFDPDNVNYEIRNSRYEIKYLEKYKISFMKILASGDAKERITLNSHEYRRIFDEVRDSYDIILVDTPPCGLVSDSVFAAQVSDASVYVVYQDTIRTSKIKSGLNNLVSSDVKVLGCVLNGVVSGITGYGHNYGYGYGYGYKYGYGKYAYGYGYGYGESKKHRSKKENTSAKAGGAANEKN